MANNVIKRVWNQNRMVNIEDLKGMAFQAEQAGHTFEISGIDDAGNVVELSGTPSGVMLRPDNTDQALTCSISGGKVYATLPAACYDVPGRFALTVYVTANSQKVAVYAAIGTVSRTSSGTASPGTTQDVIDLINAINAAIAQIPASDTNLKAALAPTYSSSGLYAVGDYCWYDGVFYRCTTAITSGETWTSGHWTAANLAVDVSNLKSALNNIVIEDISEYFYKADTIKGSNGTEVTYAGYDLYKFPLLPGTVVNVKSATGDAFWGDVVIAYVHCIELENGTYINLSNAGNVYTVFNVSDARITAYGHDNTKYLYVVIKNDVSSFVKFEINRGKQANENEIIVISKETAIESECNIAGNAITRLESPYYSLSISVKEGDMIRFSGRAGVVTSNALFRDTSWNLTDIKYTIPVFIAPSDGVLCIFEMAGATNKAICYPKAAPESWMISKKGYGEINPKNIITDPILSNISNWTISDSSGGGSWSIIETDDNSNILNITSGTNQVYITPPTDKTKQLTSCEIAFKFKGETGKGCGIHFVASAKNSNNQTIAIINTTYLIWDKTDRDWCDVIVKIPLASEITYIEFSIRMRESNYSCQFKEFYIGEETDRFPFTINNGIEYDGISENVEKTLPLYGKTVVCFGDSITDNGYNVSRDVATNIHGITGGNIINFGFGGCQMSQHHTNYYDPFSMYRLAYAIANNDWDLQDVALELTPIPANAAEKITKIKSVDFSKVDTITIAYGTNDWGNNQVLDNENNRLDTDTIGGALRYSIETLLTAFPNLRISIVSATWRCKLSGSTIVSDSDTDQNTNGNTLPQVNELLKDIADEYHLNFIDVYNNTTFNRYTFEQNFVDAIHPGFSGMKTLARIISKSIQ